MDENDLDEMFGSKYHLETTPEQRVIDRANRAAEVKELQKKYPHFGCYSMSEKEEASAAEFWDEHECKYRGKYSGAIGGTRSVEFSPNSIGQVVIVKCYCGAEKDVSDYEW